MIEIVQAERGHIPWLAARMRPDDQREVWAAAMLLPRAALERSLDASALAWTGLADNEPAAMFGCADNHGYGVPWLLGTELIERHAGGFLRRSRPIVAEMTGRFGALANFADARNARALRWLRWLGFELLPAVPWGAFARPFVPFRMGF